MRHVCGLQFKEEINWGNQRGGADLDNNNLQRENSMKDKLEVENKTDLWNMKADTSCRRMMGEYWEDVRWECSLHPFYSNLNNLLGWNVGWNVTVWYILVRYGNYRCPVWWCGEYTCHTDRFVENSRSPWSQTIHMVKESNQKFSDVTVSTHAVCMSNEISNQSLLLKEMLVQLCFVFNRAWGQFFAEWQRSF